MTDPTPDPVPREPHPVPPWPGGPCYVRFKACGCGVLVGEFCECAAFLAEVEAAFYEVEPILLPVGGGR